jgi:hypothetical protein
LLQSLLRAEEDDDEEENEVPDDEIINQMIARSRTQHHRYFFLNMSVSFHPLLMVPTSFCSVQHFSALAFVSLTLSPQNFRLKF